MYKISPILRGSLYCVFSRMKSNYFQHNDEKYRYRGQSRRSDGVRVEEVQQQRVKFLCLPSISSGHGSNGLLHPVQSSPMMACACEEASDHHPSGACGAAP